MVVDADIVIQGVWHSDHPCNVRLKCILWGRQRDCNICGCWPSRIESILHQVASNNVVGRALNLMRSREITTLNIPSRNNRCRVSIFVVLTIVVLTAAVACDSSTDLPVESTKFPTPPIQVAPPAQIVISAPADPELRQASRHLLASGKFDIPAASSFVDSGFHKVLTASHTTTDTPASSAGQRLVVRLWDVQRPDVTCSREHPLSGCATVDWSDAPGRPNVPSTGVFENSVTLQLASGERTFYLSESGILADSPDRFGPG